MAEARFKVYSYAKFIGNRPELTHIAGARVLIIGRCPTEDGSWTYTIAVDTPGTAPRAYECTESELACGDGPHNAEGAFPGAIFRIKNVDFRVESAWLYCLIEEDATTDWWLDISASGKHRGHILNPSVTFRHLATLPPGATRHWSALDNTSITWRDCYETQFQARLHAMKTTLIRNGNLQLDFLEGTVFRIACQATCDIGWEPDLAWDLALTIDTPVEFAGVYAPGLTKAEGPCTVEWAFDPDRFDLAQSPLDSRDRMYRPKARIDKA